MERKNIKTALTAFIFLFFYFLSTFKRSDCVTEKVEPNFYFFIFLFFYFLSTFSKVEPNFYFFILLFFYFFIFLLFFIIIFYPPFQRWSQIFIFIFLFFIFLLFFIIFYLAPPLLKVEGHFSLLCLIDIQ